VAVLVCASHAVRFRPSTTPPLIFPNRERRSRQSRRAAAPYLPISRTPHEAPWRPVTAVRIFAAALAGAAVAVFAWLVLVPWDLSEVSGDGRMLDGGDDNAPEIALVAVAVVAIGLIAIGRRVTRGDAPAFVAGGLAAWAALFAWRAGVSETSGANMFVVPLVMMFIPVAVVTPLVLRAVASRLNRE
jgi:hypothetical protein